MSAQIVARIGDVTETFQLSYEGSYAEFFVIVDNKIAELEVLGYSHIKATIHISC